MIATNMHWTQRKSKKPSVYHQTLGNPYMRSIMIEALFGDLDRAKSPGHKRAIINDLRSLSVGDYTPADEGMAPKGAE